MISFTPEEIKLYELNSTVGPDGHPQTQWDTKKAAENIKDCPMDEYTINLVRDVLRKMSDAHKLTDEYYSLYEKLIVAYQ